MRGKGPTGTTVYSMLGFLKKKSVAREIEIVLKMKSCPQFDQILDERRENGLLECLSADASGADGLSSQYHHAAWPPVAFRFGVLANIGS